MDPYLVEQVCSEQMPGDIRAQHQNVLVFRGLLGAPNRSIQAVEGKHPAVVAEQVLPWPMGDHEAGKTRPWRATPRAHAQIERAPSDDQPPFAASPTSLELSVPAIPALAHSDSPFFGPARTSSTFPRPVADVRFSPGTAADIRQVEEAGDRWISHGYRPSVRHA